ncbi:MAG: hypothetical protein OSB69_20605, partial [Alphaproteobacteria bacterium]|nr:hypothetical protein [Alphaproteobacteria bacterium]
KPSALAGITTRQVVVADLEDGGVVIRQTTPALERASFILNFLSPRNLTNLNAPVDAWAVEVIEEGHIDSIFSWPTNPYTQGFFTACHCPTQTRTPSL